CVKEAGRYAYGNNRFAVW
nr:immunoglobulin heavy chain junction region [Macaca mulatta]